MSQRIPVEQVMTGATLHPLDEGVEFTEAIVFIKTTDDEGDAAWSFRTTSQLNLNEVLGLLTVYCDILRKDLAEEWEF